MAWYLFFSFLGAVSNPRHVRLQEREAHRVAEQGPSLGLVQHSCADYIDRDSNWQSLRRSLGEILNSGFPWGLRRDSFTLGHSIVVAFVLPTQASPVRIWALVEPDSFSENLFFLNLFCVSAVREDI